MALARIITRSQACARELALDLLARGYAVEIVSPDAIPDSLADLELRVDAGPGDQLTANVTANVPTQDGNHSSSLEFLHHLRAPLGDFIRRTPEAQDSFFTSDVSAPTFTETVEGPVGMVSASDGILDERRRYEEDTHRFEVDSEDDIINVNLDDRSAEDTIANEPVAVHSFVDSVDHKFDHNFDHDVDHKFDHNFDHNDDRNFDHNDDHACEDRLSADFVAVDPAVGPSVAARASWRVALQATSGFTRLLHRVSVRLSEIRVARRDSAGWPWQPALAITVLGLLALATAIVLHRPGKVAAQDSAKAATVDAAVASNSVALLNATVPVEDSKNETHTAVISEKTVKPDAIRPNVKSTLTESNNDKSVANHASVTATARTSPRGGSRVSRKTGDEVVARDTVTYLDDRYKPAPGVGVAKKAPHRGAMARKHNGEVIAANKVTYLDKPAPKPAK